MIKSVFPPAPLVAAALCAALCAGCDSGDIYPERIENQSGATATATFVFEDLNAFPSSYLILFGAFGDGEAEPLVSKTIVKPRRGEKTSVTLNSLPDGASRLKLCLATLGKQPVYTFCETEIAAAAGDSIVIKEQRIRLVQFDRVQQQIFTPCCVACHGNPGAAGLSLVDGKSYAGLVGVRAAGSAESKYRVAPSDADNSFIVNILENGDLLKVDHASIPSKYDDDLALLKEWIRGGALEKTVIDNF